MKKYPTKDWIP